MCNVPEGTRRAVGNILDNLRRSSWASVKRKLQVDVGLDEAVLRTLGEVMQLKCRLEDEKVCLWEGRGMKQAKPICTLGTEQSCLPAGGGGGGRLGCAKF